MNDKEKNELIPIYRKDEIVPIINTISKLEQASDFDKLFKISKSLSEYIANIKTGISDDNAEEMSELNTCLNKAAEKISRIRIDYKNAYLEEIEDKCKSLSNLENLLKFKKESIKKEVLKNNEKTLKTRVLLFEEEFKTQVQGYELFDWITFNEVIYDEKMKNKGNFNIDKITKEETLKKGAIKEFIIDKLERFDDDKLALGDDQIAIDHYRKNNYNVAQAVAFSKQQRNLLNKEEEIKTVKEPVIKETTVNPRSTVTKTTTKVTQKTETIQILVKVKPEMKAALIKNFEKFNLEYEILGE